MLPNVVPEFVMETEVPGDKDPKSRKIQQIVDPEDNNPKSPLEEGAKEDFLDHSEQLIIPYYISKG